VIPSAMFLLMADSKIAGKKLTGRKKIEENFFNL
jgi:hypothetical protein